MPNDLVITLLILFVAAVLLLSDRVRADLVALLVAVALGVSGVLAPREAFSGFSSSAVVTMAAIFVLVAGLQVTGVTSQAGRLLQRLAGADERRLLVAVMAIGALLSLFMNNIAAAAILLPAVSGLASRTQVRLSRLLMPLAFATILGGMATLFTTTNIIVSGLLRSQGLPGFGVLDFLPVGGPMALAGIVFVILVGVRLLPARQGMDGRLPAATGHPDLVGVYRLDERLFRARVPAGSVLIGRPIAASPLRERFGVTVVALERNGALIPVTSPETIVAQDDVIVLEGDLDEFSRRDVEPHLEILPTRQWTERDLETDAVVVVEAVLAPRSGLLGQTLRAARFRDKYGMAVLGIWRQGRPLRTNLGDLPLQFGDALLLQGPRERVPLLETEPDLIILAGEAERGPALMPDKGRLAVGVMAVTLALATVNPTLVGEIMLAGALAMVLVRLLTMDQVYNAIEWRSIFLVAGLLPLGLAMAESGAAALLAERLVAWLNPLGPASSAAGLALLAVLLTQVINGAAVASVIAPVAIQAAQQTGLDPRALAMGVALACSMAFMTPLGHAVNVLIMGPAGYRFGDFFRIGLPLTVVVFIVLMALLPMLWPLAAP
ncbi:MAG TPA: SLC13 family permease [Anaerolineae bacterium]|nr:SLC13 family permease [Anaerolineae bacterium]